MKPGMVRIKPIYMWNTRASQKVPFSPRNIRVCLVQAYVGFLLSYWPVRKGIADMWRLFGENLKQSSIPPYTRYGRPSDFSILLTLTANRDSSSIEEKDLAKRKGAGINTPKFSTLDERRIKFKVFNDGLQSLPKFGVLGVVNFCSMFSSAENIV
ncbi:hypothetical protein TNCV_2548051 [Trichonephila clavipes]|nr:hypothetical protein TNCV_2548051 [Trichonephila clavipes]